MTAEPLFPAGTPAGSERVLGVVDHTRPAPGGGIAEALASVFAPGARTVSNVVRRQRVFAPGGGEAQFTSGAGADLSLEQRFPGLSGGIAKAQPDEVEELVGDDAGELDGIAAERAVEDDDALAGKGGGVDLIAGAGAAVQTSPVSPQRGTPSNQDRLPVERGKRVEVPDYFWAGPDK